MAKYWIKVKNEDKILSDILLCGNSLYDVLKEAADKLDILTPIVLSSHNAMLERFNRVEFLPRDFICDVNFTSLEVEKVD